MIAATEKRQLTPEEFRAQHPALRFDPWQFDSRKSLARNLGAIGPGRMTDTMQIFRVAVQRPERYRAAWAQNESQFQKVILTRAAQWCCGKAATSADLTQMRDLCAAKLRRLKAETPKNVARRSSLEKEISVLDRFGGYLQLISMIAWKSYRQGLPGNQIAEEMEVSAFFVRTHLCRLNAVAAKLGFPTTPVFHHSKGVPRKHSVLEKKRKTMGCTVPDQPEPLRYTAAVHADVLKCRGLKWTWIEIAARWRTTPKLLLAAYRNGQDGKFAADRRRRPWYTPGIHAEVIQLRKEGHSWPRIAKAFHKSVANVLHFAYYVHPDWPRVPRIRSAYTADQHAFIIQLRLAGTSWHDIGRWYGVKHIYTSARYHAGIFGPLPKVKRGRI